MSDAVNPYQSPETAAVPEKPLVAQGAITETMLLYLKQASPWLRFIGIFGIVSAGVTALSGLSFIFFIPSMNQIWSGIPGFDLFGNIFGFAFSGSMVILCIGAAVIIFFPALFIYRFGGRVRSYLRSGLDQELEEAFKNNRSLWKFIGIYCIVQLAFFPVLIIGAVIIGVVLALA